MSANIRADILGLVGTSVGGPPGLRAAEEFRRWAVLALKGITPRTPIEPGVPIGGCFARTASAGLGSVRASPEAIRQLLLACHPL